MNDVNDATLRQCGLITLVRRGGGVVAIVEKLMKDYQKGAPRDIVSIERWMEHWCDGRDLPSVAIQGKSAAQERNQD